MRSKLSGVQIPTAAKLNIDGEFTVDASAGTTGQVLTSQGAGATPIWSNVTNANWDTAYTDRNKWDGGSTGLVAATGRTSLGATTVGSNLFTLTNPSAITFPKINADNTVSTESAATHRTSLGLAIGTDVQAYSATLAGINTLGSGTGFLKNAAGTWSYDNSTYLTTRGYIGTTQTTAASAGVTTLAGINTFTPSAAATIKPADFVSTGATHLTIASGTNTYAAGFATGSTLTLTGGAATGGTSASSNGGLVQITGGDSNLTAGTGGSVQIAGGAGFNQGNVTLIGKNVYITTSATSSLYLPSNPILRYHPTDVALGGQISFARATDNTARWDIRAAGSNNFPALAFVEAGTTQMSIATGGATTHAGSVTLSTSNTGIILPASTGTVAPIKINAGTATGLANWAAGNIEYDGKTFFSTASTTTGPGIMPSTNYFALGSNLSLTATNTTMFGQTMTLPIGSYEFEIQAAFSYTYIAPTATSLTLGVKGTAVTSNISFTQEHYTNTGALGNQMFGFTPSNSTYTQGNGKKIVYWRQSTTSQSITTSALTTTINTLSSGSEYGIYRAKGTITVTTSGTFFPSVTIGGTGNGTIYTGSFFKVTPININAGYFASTT